MPSSDDTNGFNRADDIERAVARVRKREESETQRQEALKKAKVDEQHKNETSMREHLAEEKEKEKNQKDFLAAKKRQGQELAKEKELRDKQAAEMKAKQEERAVQSKEQQAYMVDLRTMADIKILKDRKMNDAQDEADREKKRAEEEYRRTVGLAQKSFMQAKKQAEQDARSRLAEVEKEKQQKFYQEEAWYGTQLRLLEAEAQKQTDKNAAAGFLKVRKQKLDYEENGRRLAIEHETQRKSSEIQKTMYAAGVLAENDQRQAVRTADQERLRQTQDIEKRLKKALQDAHL